ncbi:MAG: NADH-quinone oxidoreductase subunit L [Acidimicrobiales bacterium]
MDAAYFVVGLPLAGALILLFVTRLRPPLPGILATAMAGGAFVATLITWTTLLGRTAENRVVDMNIFSWIPVGGLKVDVGLRIDPLSITMALFVTGVGSLIHLYSIGYMRGDPSFSRFFFYLNLFLFSMLVLVMADNYLFCFLGWEGVGFCSYGLVGFWFERNSAAVAAKKAFVTNRIGDVGFMIALFLLFQHFGSFDFSSVLGPLAAGKTSLAGVTATGIGLMLLLGAVGKSAQVPLYMWLPDAMEGPTPVSALIHAATMVTAGVYLIARSAPILHFSPLALSVVASLGAASAFLAATIACAQDDIKRVLAYSTISQLGYMFLAEGSGAYSIGLFHMITHAFFKALLFLAAGSVIQAMHDDQNMKHMGGLRKYLPITFPTFIFGYLALTAIPPFAGFWSKDDVLAAAWGNNKALWAVGLITAGLTAYYMSRQVVLVFAGKARWTEARPGGDSHSGTPHESPRVMTFPLIVLAAASLLGGLVNFPAFHLDFLDRFLAPVFPSTIAPAVVVSTGTKWVIGTVAVLVSLGGLALGLRTWRRSPVHPSLEPAFLQHAWYIDDDVSLLVSGPLAAGARGLAFGLDAGVIDGGINGLGRLTAATGRQLRRVQTGYLRTYALFIAFAAVVVLAYVAIRVRG